MQWAEDFNLSGTWVEEEARKIALTWIPHQGATCKHLPLTVIGGTDCPSIQEIVLHIPVPLEFQIERPYFSWKRLREFVLPQLEPALDAELRKIRNGEMDSGSSVEINLASDLPKRMAATALYLFRNLTPEQIRALPQQSQNSQAGSDWATVLQAGLARERTVINRWIQDMTRLLDLEKVRLRRVKNHRRTSGHVAKRG